MMMCKMLPGGSYLLGCNLFTQLQLYVITLGATHAGGFSTGIYQTNIIACEYIAKDSRAHAIVVGDQVQITKILSLRDKLPNVKAIVLYEGYE